MRVWVEYNAVETIEVRRGGYMTIDDNELSNDHDYTLADAVAAHLDDGDFDYTNLSGKVVIAGPAYGDLNLVIRVER